MFLVIAHTREGEALYPNFRDLKSFAFPRLIGLMVDGWLLHPNMMLFHSSVVWLDLLGGVCQMHLLLPAEILLHDWHLGGCGLTHPGFTL